MNYVILISLFSTIAFGQSNEPSKIEPDTIKFKISEHNNIVVDAILNDIDTISLMLHTDVKSVSLTPETSSRIEFHSKTDSSNARSWTGNRNVEYTTNNTLEISNLKWDDLTLWLNLLSGHTTDGKFGLNLFPQRLIELNFDQELIVLHSTSLTITELDDYQIFNLTTNENNSIFIEGELNIDDKIFSNRFLIHSGYSSTIILDDKFCEENPIVKSIPTIEINELKDSFGNVIKTKKVKANKLTIFNKEFDNIPFSYFDSELEIQKTSVIGGELLKRFNLILDLENMKVYAKQSKYCNNEFKSS